jgi:hypothetical protein
MWLSFRKCGEEKALASGLQVVIFTRFPARSSTSWRSIRTPRLLQEIPFEVRCDLRATSFIERPLEVAGRPVGVEAALEGS